MFHIICDMGRCYDDDDDDDDDYDYDLRSIFRLLYRYCMLQRLDVM